MTINAPHGGQLVDLMLPPEEARDIRGNLGQMSSWTLTDRQLCDLELLLCGGFSPLGGFLGQADYQTVVSDLRLADGTVWPMPITLDVPENLGDELDAGDSIVLRDAEGVPLAVLEDIEIYRPDRQNEAELVFGTLDTSHPGVNHLLTQTHPVYLGGNLRGLSSPSHYDFRHLRHTPTELRRILTKLGWRRVVAFQTRNPMHRAHQELTYRAAQRAEANLLIHPVVGMTKPGDVDHYTRVRCYEAMTERFPDRTTMLSLLPLAMRMGGPREALWHALIRKNYGASHFIIGRDHAGPGANSEGEPFYGAYEAQELVGEYSEEIGMEMVEFEEMVYVEDRAQFVPRSQVKDEQRVLSISGTELRRRLAQGLDIPEWFSYPEVIAELRKSYPPRHEQGFTVFFTGLSGAGKSTIANALLVYLLELGERPVTLLDGDIVRQNLSSELGFSREHRDLNVNRIGFVASEITKNRGVAICAPIAPYAASRDQVRRLISTYGSFVEIHVSTPLEVCEERDRKGLYAQARKGLIKDFTGISDPYEEPEDPELRIDTSEVSPGEAAQRVVLKLENLGLIRPG